MEVEIVFSGLCAFNNVRDTNSTMGEPSVILIRTDQEQGGGGPQARSLAVEAKVNDWRARLANTGGKDKSAARAVAAVASDNIHIPYIAYDTRTTVVNDDASFQDVDLAPFFRFIPINGVEIVIENDTTGKPTVDQSYDLMLRKDDYWPEAKDQWNRDFVPTRGNKPSKAAVAGFLRFGSGTLSGGQLSPDAWLFQRQNDGPLLGSFAQEIVYSGFPHSGNDVVIRLFDLETGVEVRDPLRFSPQGDDVEVLTLFIGNNDVVDMDDAVQRTAPQQGDGDHFKFFSRIAALSSPGPLPEVIHPRIGGNGRAGGLSTGPCGPINTNGR